LVSIRDVFDTMLYFLPNKSSVQWNARNWRKLLLHFSKYNRNVLEKELATFENLSLLKKSSTSDFSDMFWGAKIFISAAFHFIC
jgi:hypothetical protein